LGQLFCLAQFLNPRPKHFCCFHKTPNDLTSHKQLL
jgi:hypothetical protein